MRLTLDFETRSTAPLPDIGSYKYADDPTTEILCLAVQEDDNAPLLWISPYGMRYASACGELPQISAIGLRDLIERADTFSAHNANFERCMWKLMVEKYNFPDISAPERWCCTAAKCAALSLPRGLADAAKVLGLAEQKANKGHRIMMKWCKPRKPSKNNPSTWCDDPEEFKILCEYCLQDVRTEYSIDYALPDLTPKEQELWILDQKINDFGVFVDLQSIHNLKAKVNAKNTWLTSEVPKLNLGIETPSQTTAIITIMNQKGYKTDTIDAGFLKKFLPQPDIDPAIRRLLEIRQLTNKTSVAKLDTIINRAQADSRVRGSLVYHGASTGRWSARGLQIQNFPRTKYKDEDVTNICKSSIFAVEKNVGPIHDVASKCLRSILTAAPGKLLTAMDFSNIEGRVAAWIAGEDWKVKAFKEFDQGIGPDLYVLTYSRSFNCPIDAVDDDKRQVGKTMELALGFAGWVKALMDMASNFGMNFEEELAADLCARWRNAHPAICAAWYAIGDAAIAAIKTGKLMSFRGIKMKVVDNFLRVRLPSGRVISYFKPSVTTKEHYGKQKEIVQYHGTHTYTRQWISDCTTHGGDIFQSIVQGTARDFLSEGMKRLHAQGFAIPFHVHDEVVVETDTDREDEVKGIMSVVPEWGVGCPIAVGGWTATRYQK